MNYKKSIISSQNSINDFGKNESAEQDRIQRLVPNKKDVAILVNLNYQLIVIDDKIRQQIRMRWEMNKSKESK